MEQPSHDPDQERRPSAAKQVAGAAAKKAAKKAAVTAAKTVAKSPIGMKIILIGGVILVLLLILVVFIGSLFMASFSSSSDTRSFTRGGQISQTGLEATPPEFIEYYKAAEAEYGVPWNILAGVHRVETVFSTNVSESYAGAVGHMQFMPCTWVGWNHPTCGGLGRGDISLAELRDPAVVAKYGGYGTDGDGDGIPDPWSVQDAIMSAAKYLAANGGADGKLDKALYAYNNSKKYVKDVLDFADSYVSGGTAIVSGEGTVWPGTSARIITSGYKVRWGKQHAGIDIAAPGDSTGIPIVAFMPGTVIFSGVRGGYGNCIIIDHGNNVSTLYGHMVSTSPFWAGDQVAAGQEIGAIGNTGGSKGAHLHFEVRIKDSPVDPLPYVKGFSPIIQDPEIK